MSVAATDRHRDAPRDLASPSSAEDGAHRRQLRGFSGRRGVEPAVDVLSALLNAVLVVLVVATMLSAGLRTVITALVAYCATCGWSCWCCSRTSSFCRS